MLSVRGVKKYHFNLLKFYLVQSLTSIEGDFPPLVMIVFILYYLFHSKSITKVT